VAVQVGRRLVGEDDRRLVGEGACDRDALPLPAGEKVGPHGRLVRKADRREQFPRAVAARGRVQALERQRVGDVSPPQ
jgi:hypothetical protein